MSAPSSAVNRRDRSRHLAAIALELRRRFSAFAGAGHRQRRAFDVGEAVTGSEVGKPLDPSIGAVNAEPAARRFEREFLFAAKLSVGNLIDLRELERRRVRRVHLSKAEKIGLKVGDR
jgi:hypothetical protein